MKTFEHANELAEALRDCEGLIELYANGDSPDNSVETVKNKDGTSTVTRRGAVAAVQDLLASVRAALSAWERHNETTKETK